MKLQNHAQNEMINAMCIEALRDQIEYLENLDLESLHPYPRKFYEVNLVSLLAYCKQRLAYLEENNIFLAWGTEVYRADGEKICYFLSSNVFWGREVSQEELRNLAKTLASNLNELEKQEQDFLDRETIELEKVRLRCCCTGVN